MKARRTPAAGEDDRHSPLLGPSDFVGAKLAAEDRGVVLDLAAWHHLDDVEQVELALRLLLAAHHQDVLEALVVFREILGRAIAHAVELEAFQCFDDLRRVEGAGHLAGVGVEQRSEEQTSELQSLMRISYAV